jgi:hypothetical protein
MKMSKSTTRWRVKKQHFDKWCFFIRIIRRSFFTPIVQTYKNWLFSNIWISYSILFRKLDMQEHP